MGQLDGELVGASVGLAVGRGRSSWGHGEDVGGRVGRLVGV